MQNNHNSACNELTSLAESGDTEAQYALGQLYYHPQQRFTEAIHWCLLAAEQQHSKATDYINNTVFPSQYYLMLARCYEDGVKGASENKELSLFFYKKAIVEQDKEAAFHLGQIYQFELEDEKTAFDYFLQAVKWGHSEAIIFLEQLGAEIDPGRQLKLANLYCDPPFNDQRKAFIWEQKAADGSRLQGSPLKEGLIDNLSKSKKMDIDLKKISLLGQQSKQQDIYFKR